MSRPGSSSDRRSNNLVVGGLTLAIKTDPPIIIGDARSL